MLESLYKYLSKPTPAFGLAVFRICFGLILLWDVIRIFRIELIESFYPRGIIFSYAFLNIPLVNSTMLTCFLYAMALCCVLIAVGYFFRFAMLIFTVLLTYLFFLDQTLYNNHIYLIILLGLIMSILPADSSLSLSKKRKRHYIPKWTYLILQFQVLVVYFFGGLAKLNIFWLSGHPTKEIIANKFAAIDMSSNWDLILVYLITYGGYSLIYLLVIYC